ncbi:hypothetical protein NQ318_008179 [Aromia moschata]|uniref:THAP-type domain-containing protein n=1 Tax=Aromia moschata TaxID=1265417 RepID=A0AAV8YHX4_9CUCU|nr:hypothetical protein NQ318_008179 [Aromia moschata]
MVKCAYCGIESVKKSGRTFHRFPLKDLFILEAWVQNMGLQGYLPSLYSVLCSAHFTEDCFERSAFSVILKKNSVPTKFEDPYNCCVCCRRKRSLTTGHSFFNFPSESELLEKWVEKIGKDKNWKPYPGALVCSRHFEKSSLQKRKDNNYVCLKKGSVPSLFDENEYQLSARGHLGAKKKHFTNDQFENNRVDKKRPLRWDAVPTIFAHKKLPKPRKLPTVRSVSPKNDISHTNSFQEPSCDPLSLTATTVTKPVMKTSLYQESCSSVQQNEPLLKIKYEPCLEIKDEPCLVIKDEPYLEIKDEPCLEIKDEPCLEIEDETRLEGEEEPCSPTGSPLAKRRAFNHDHTYNTSSIILSRKYAECKEKMKEQQCLLYAKEKQIVRLKKKIESLQGTIRELLENR